MGISKDVPGFREAAWKVHWQLMKTTIAHFVEGEKTSALKFVILWKSLRSFCFREISHSMTAT